MEALIALPCRGWKQQVHCPAGNGQVLQLRQQLSRSSPSLALQNLPAGLQISVQGTTDPLSKQPSLVVQLLQPKGPAGGTELAEGGQMQELPPQGTSSQHQVGSDCAPAWATNIILDVRTHGPSTLAECVSTPLLWLAHSNWTSQYEHCTS